LPWSAGEEQIHVGHGGAGKPLPGRGPEGMRPMFAAASIELSGGFKVSAPLENAFELFSPRGEKRWVPGWDPELLHPPGVDWARGLIFRTQEQQGEAVWMVTHLDRPGHDVEYVRVEPGRYVATVRVQGRARGATETDVRVTYVFVGLSESGNREIAAMSQAAFDEKMTRWQQWIGDCLAGG
jgi:hypothetical protein